MDYPKFKHQIELLRDYKRSLAELLFQLDLLTYQLENVKAISYDKEPGSPNPNSEQYRLDLIERKNDLERKIDHTIMFIQKLEPEVLKTINSMRGEGKLILIAKYGIDLETLTFGTEKTYEELCEMFNYSGTASVWRKMKKAVEDI